MKPLKHSSLQCIYCDDIRDEASGKTTIIGWYGGEHVQLPPEGPLLLPTLCVLGLAAIPLELKYTSFKVELLQDDVILQSVSIPPDSVKEMQEGNSGTFMGKQIRVAIKLANMQVNNPCVLRLRMLVDDDELYGSGLRFTRP